MPNSDTHYLESRYDDAVGVRALLGHFLFGFDRWPRRLTGDDIPVRDERLEQLKRKVCLVKSLASGGYLDACDFSNGLRKKGLAEIKDQTRKSKVPDCSGTLLAVLRGTSAR